MLLREFIMTQPSDVREEAILEDDKIYIPMKLTSSELEDAIDFREEDKLDIKVKALYMFLCRNRRPDLSVEEVLNTESI